MNDDFACRECGGVGSHPVGEGGPRSLLDRLARWAYWHGWIILGVRVTFEPGPTFTIPIPFGKAFFWWGYRHNQRRLIAREGFPVRPWHREDGVLP